MKFIGVEMAGQHKGPDDLASLFPGPAAQIRRRSAPADEIVRHRVLAALVDITTQACLTPSGAGP